MIDNKSLKVPAGGKKHSKKKYILYYIFIIG
jgi:hypothetical protein